MKDDDGKKIDKITKEILENIKKRSDDHKEMLTTLIFLVIENRVKDFDTKNKLVLLIEKITDAPWEKVEKLFKICYK